MAKRYFRYGVMGVPARGRRKAGGLGPRGGR